VKKQKEKEMGSERKKMKEEKRSTKEKKEIERSPARIPAPPFPERGSSSLTAVSEHR
jgi:hypothetical protein